MSYSYGQIAAMQRAAKRAGRRPGTSQAKRRRSATRQVANPTPYEPYPLDGYSYQANDTIDWADADMLSCAAEIARRMLKNDPTATILKLPTGTGKTAIAVCALGMVQETKADKLCFLVTAKTKIIEQKNWHETIASYNAHHPQNQLRPYLLQPYDSFANILSHPQTLAAVKDALGADGIIVVDEIHNYKSATKRRAKQLHKLSGHHILGLSATPTTNNPIQDAISYLVMAGYYRSDNDFKTQHKLKDRTDRFGQLDVYDETGRVSRALFPTYDRFLRELQSVLYAPDINIKDLDMPELKERVIQLPYSERLEERTESIRRAYRDRMFDTATDVRMALIDCIVSDASRLDALVRIAAGDVNQLLVFYWHKSALRALSERFDAEGMRYQVIAGNTKLSAIDFSCPDPIFIQYQAGAEGLDDLKASTGTVFYENQYSYIKQKQAKGRNLRRGQGGKTKHWYLIASVAFDMALYENLQKMGELNDAILDDMALASLGLKTEG